MKPILVFRDKISAKIQVIEFHNRGQMEVFIENAGPTITVFAKIMGRIL